jgi:hypothetical protein
MGGGDKKGSSSNDDAAIADAALPLHSPHPVSDHHFVNGSLRHRHHIHSGAYVIDTTVLSACVLAAKALHGAADAFICGAAKHHRLN